VSDAEKLRQQVHEIGARFLQRTLRELEPLEELRRRLRAGDRTCLMEIQRLAHRIHGSGAMFGFDTISAHAREIELLAGSDAVGTDLLLRLESCLLALKNATVAAAATRGLQ
jgi:HPt (histidine-containing phosphotransfer) domain-containing protein